MKKRSVAASILLAVCLWFSVASGSSDCYLENSVVMYCLGDSVNCRRGPDKNDISVCRLSKGQVCYGVYYENSWVAIDSGLESSDESGHWLLYVRWEYLSERLDEFRAKNTSNGHVNIRSEPRKDAKKVGRIKKGKIVTVTKVLFGYGYIGSGWVDLSYFTELE